MPACHVLFTQLQRLSARTRRRTGLKKRGSSPPDLAHGGANRPASSNTETLSVGRYWKSVSADMFPISSNWKPINLQPKPSLTQFVGHLQLHRSMHGGNAKSQTWNVNHWIRAPARRVLLIQILVVFGTMSCRNPILVDGLARAGDLFDPREVSSGEVVLQGLPYTANLRRPGVSSLQPLKDDELEEILSVKLKLLRGRASAFRVFINLPDANVETPITCSEFGGLYLHEPRRVPNPDSEFQVTSFRIGISDIIKDLGLSDQPNILVTFVPCGADKGFPVLLENVGIELE